MATSSCTAGIPSGLYLESSHRELQPECFSLCPQSSDTSLLRCQPVAHKDKTVVEKEFNHVIKDMLYGKKNKIFNIEPPWYQTMLLVAELHPRLHYQEYRNSPCTFSISKEYPVMLSK